MPGQYVTFEIHGVPTSALVICNVGVLGNNFIRDTPSDTTVGIAAGKTHTIKIEHIRPEFT